jgi:hypothetical protein
MTDRPILAAYYFSDVGVVNFWQSFSPARLEEELRTFKEDGLNTIFVLVPWACFQPDTSPVRYNDDALHLLDRIFHTAEGLGLRVGMRLSFLWEATQTRDRTYTRLQQMHTKPELDTAWIDYFSTLYKRFGTRPNHAVSFLAWEDFYWPCYSPAISRKDRTSIHTFLAETGFLEYLDRRFPNGYAFSESGILPENPDLWHAFLEYWDRTIERLFRLAHSQFPNLGYEYRSDSEHLQKQQGQLYYHYHRRMFSTTCFPMTYYNQFSCKETDLSKNFNQWVRLQQSEIGERFFISQFNCVDNTYDSSEFDAIRQHLGARDMTHQTIEGFLKTIDTQLATATLGYAFWAYRDIPNDCLYNSHFERGLEGFEQIGTVLPERQPAGDTVVRMAGLSRIWQDLKYCPLGGRLKETTLWVKGTCTEQAEITLAYWGNRKTFQLEPGKFSIELRNDTYDSPPSKDELHCALVECLTGSITVERVAFFNIELTNLMYNRENQQRPLVQTVRDLNERLVSPQNSKLWSDGTILPGRF